MEICFGGIVLRPWLRSDAEELAVIANNKEIADYLRDGFPSPYSLQDAINWLEMVIPKNEPPLYFAILIEGKLAGSIGLVSKSDIYRLNFEMGYFLSPHHWGKGIITKAIRAITAYGFSEFDVIRIYAEPFEDNPGSRRVLEKAGYIHEATFRKNVIKNGKIKNSCIYSVLKENFRED
jgi:ribosomal-protein-alanine N-acetyltransferase